MKDKARILVVDDEESIRYTFESFLSDSGHAVSTAGSYNAAMTHIEETDFDLIFADIVLGGKTGLDMIRELRNRNIVCPVVFITGVPNIENAADAVRLGAFDYISKPVTQDKLLHVTRMALNHKTLNDIKEKYRMNLEAIFRSVKDALITVDKDLNVIEVNKAAGEICGFSRDIIGKDFRSLHFGCSGKCLEALAETISKRQSVEISRLECRHKKHPAHIVNISASPLLDQHGAFSGSVILSRDETRMADLEKKLSERQGFCSIVGISKRMQDIYSLIETLKDTQTTVLVTGESGTGKELIAEALHYSGIRRDKPLVKVNCSALSENLLESELFGHVKGAFTGAIKDKVGRFQKADRGTIFLDEIGDISHRIQRSLLRVIQDMEFERVGDSTPLSADVRLIAATNQSIPEKVRFGHFREDLYYRLKVVQITVPPLREHLEDIPLLTDHFIKKFNEKLGKDIKAISSDVLNIFMSYPWPGNIRELEHSIEHSFILSRHDTITIADLPQELRDFAEDTSISCLDKVKDEPLEILQALEKTAWNKAKAARVLGVDRKTLYRKIEKYKILKNHE